MANPLTGDYEAVVQIAVRQVNGLLGTLNQNSDRDTALKILHVATTRIGDPRPRRPDVGPLRDWVVEMQKAGPGRGLNDLRAELSATAPPGIAKSFTEAFDALLHESEIELPPDVVRGKVKVQVSAVTISVPSGSTSEVVIHAPIRAHYYPDPGTTELPATIHGEVHATYDVTKIPHRGGRRLLIRPSAQDGKIGFTAAPGSGLTSPQVSRISGEVRKFVREGLSLLPVDLPADFAFSDFKGLGTGQDQAIALPLQISGAALPSTGPHGITESFIGASGFGFAVSKERIDRLLDVNTIRERITARPLTVTLSRWGVSISVTYRLRFSSGPTLTFTNGAIELTARIEAETDTWWAPNGYFAIKQPLRLVLYADTQQILVARVGDPEVDKSWFIPGAIAVSRARSALDNALAANRGAVRRVFEEAKASLVKGVRTFDPGASARYTGVEVVIAGVVVRGEIAGTARRAPVVSVGQTHGGSAFTALESWIPAGHIDRFVWSWVEHSSPSILSGVAKSATEEHRFIIPVPTGITGVSQVCLRVEGTQLAPSGHTAPITGGTTCHLRQPEYALDVPAWWGPLAIPVFNPGLADSASLRQAIIAHLSVQAAAPKSGLQQRNALVYFVDESDRPLDAVLTALKKAKNPSAVVTTVVCPAGSFDVAGCEFAEKLGLPRGTTSPLHFTEDDENGWTRAFGVTRTPSAYLVNARREFVWSHEGQPDPTTLAAAIDTHITPVSQRHFRPIQLTVSRGDAAYDAEFHSGAEQYALHRMRGREVLVNFWQSWSAPCLEELRRLQLLLDGPQAPFVVAFHGGAADDAVDDIGKRLGLSFPLVPDPQQRMARRYGVGCWPTTVRIGVDGRVEHIQFGVAHRHKGSDVSAALG